MDSKIIKECSLKETPYKIFSNGNNPLYHKKQQTNLLNKSKAENKYNKRYKISRLKINDTQTSEVSSISKSLKSVVLNSDLFSNYIDYHYNITQEDSFKRPKVRKYPLLKNKDVLSITFNNLTNRSSNKVNLFVSTDISNPIFLSHIRQIKAKKKIAEINPIRLNYEEVKRILDKDKFSKSPSAGKDFGELCENSLFKSEFLKTIKLRKIDMNNCFEENQKNFQFFWEYIKKGDELNNILNKNNFHKNITFNGRTAIKKQKMEFKLDIYSLCFKFFSLSDNNINNTKEKEVQKLYFPFVLMPLFYMLDFSSFKTFLSEIIIFNKDNNCFEYIKENLLIKIVKKYFDFINNSLENKKDYINNITYNKKETMFSLLYDWIITNYSLNGEEEEKNDNNLKNEFYNNYKCFKLKIVLPKIKFYVNNLKIKVNRFLSKYTIAKILQNKFQKWEKYVFFDLFSIKRFKVIINLIMINKYNKIPLKKIKLNKNYQVHNQNYEFFLTQIGEDNSLYYTFIPYTILIVFGEKIKKFQKINLNLKESINLVKLGKAWGIINTLFKCMFIDKLKNYIFFKFELLEDEHCNTIKEKNDKNNNHLIIKNSDNDTNTNNNIKKVFTKNKSIREKLMDNIQMRYKDRMYEIRLLNCSLRKINITSSDSEEKYYVFPQNILNNIFNIEDKSKIFNINYTDVSLMGKYIGENIKSILSAKEANNISEEKKMMNKADIGYEEPKIILPIKKEAEKPISRNTNAFDGLKTFQTNKSNTKIREEIKKEEKVENKIDNDNKIKVEKKYTSSKYVFPKGIFFARSEKRKVSITNMNELNQNRFENISRDIIRRRTLNLNKYN